VIRSPLAALLVALPLAANAAEYMEKTPFQLSRALSPGIVLLSALIERAIGEGLERFDFMRGLERYKLELGARPADLMRLRLAPR